MKSAKSWKIIISVLIILFIIFISYKMFQAFHNESLQAPSYVKKETKHITPKECGNEQNKNSIKIAAFNIQSFGKKKMSDKDVTDILVKIISEFDLILIQEIRDASDTSVDIFLEKINEKHGFEKFSYIKSPRLGSSSSKEEYAYFYDKCQIDYIQDSSYVYSEESSTDFEREPYIATFKSGQFDFTLIGIHTSPKKAKQEIGNLSQVVKSAKNNANNDRDIIILGDFNADGDYFNENDYTNALRSKDFYWLISNDEDTMLSSNNTYDRIVTLKNTADYEYVASSAKVFDYSIVYKINNQDLLKKVSDHFPVFAEFRTNLKDDD